MSSYAFYRTLIVELHDRVPADVGGVIYEGGIDWAAEGLYNGMTRGQEPRRIAGIAMFRIVTGHPFYDGNHRTAALVANWVLEETGYRLTCGQPEFARFDKRIDMENLSVDEVVGWLRKNTGLTGASRRELGGLG